MTPSSATASSSRAAGPSLCVLLLACAGLASCGTPGAYDIDLPPPSGDEPVAQALPLRIGGAARVIEPLAGADGRLRGVRASYGLQATIELLRAESARERHHWFESGVRPRLLRLGSTNGHASADRWQAVAPDGARLLAWRNRDWLFLIEAADATLFDEVVDHLAWIGRRQRWRWLPAAVGHPGSADATGPSNLRGDNP